MTTSELRRISGGHHYIQLTTLTVCYGPTFTLPGKDNATFGTPTGGTVFFPKF